MTSQRTRIWQDTYVQAIADYLIDEYINPIVNVVTGTIYLEIKWNIINIVKYELIIKLCTDGKLKNSHKIYYFKFMKKKMRKSKNLYKI